jgi:hypothetical protein
MQSRPPLQGIADIKNLFDLYVDQNRFLSIPEAGLYLYMSTQASRRDDADELSLTKLVELMGMSKEKVVQCMDRLSDVMLIDENWYAAWLDRQGVDL